MVTGRQHLVEQILDHIQFMGTEVEVLSGVTAGFIRLNRTDLRAIQVLRGSGGMTAGELARALAITSGATTRVIDSLSTAGHALREGDPSDRRRVLVKLTPEAASMYDRSFDRLREQTRRLLEPYSEDELVTLARFLGDVRALIRAHARRLVRSAPE